MQQSHHINILQFKDKPPRKAEYELQEIGTPTQEDILKQRFPTQKVHKIYEASCSNYV